MKRRTIILYWALLLVPTLAIAIAAGKLLVHEQERMQEVERSSALAAARAAAETIQMTVETVKGQFTQALREIRRDAVVETLRTWSETNPLVRNVFVWTPAAGLRYPLPGRASTSEERRFIQRYAALFSGRVQWEPGRSATRSVPGETDHQETAGATRLHEGAASQRALTNEAQTGLLGQSELKQLASGKTRGATRQSSPAGGWIPWFSENRLHILGWVRRGNDGMVYGFELELMALLSRMVADFPTPLAGALYALIDGEGNILHQTGGSDIPSGVKPTTTVSLGPSLPHWQLGVYESKTSPTYGKQGFLILAGLLLATFVASIVLGGALLTWQAHRNMIEARQKTSFVSNVSHALKTPLTNIRLYAELLGENRVPDPEKKRRYQQVILEESLRLSRLVDDVLDFTRLEQGRRTYNFKELDLAEFLEALLEAQRLRLSTAGLRLELAMLHRPLLVRTDRDALESALLNIVDNAAKYAADGGELLVTVEPQSGEYRICILDRGPGISAFHREAVFEEFHRVDDSLTSGQSGTGLGLAIARRTIRGLGGDITYEPREGGGSCFMVVLPAGRPGDDV